MTAQLNRLLQVIYSIVHDDPQPLRCPVGPRSIILRFEGGWQIEYLDALAAEGLIEIKTTDRIVIYLTQKGWTLAKEQQQALKQDSNRS